MSFKNNKYLFVKTGLIDVGGYEKLQNLFLISSAPDVIETHTRFGKSLGYIFILVFLSFLT